MALCLLHLNLLITYFMEYATEQDIFVRGRQPGFVMHTSSLNGTSDAWFNNTTHILFFRFIIKKYLTSSDEAFIFLIFLRIYLLYIDDYIFSFYLLLLLVNHWLITLKNIFIIRLLLHDIIMCIFNVFLFDNIPVIMSVSLLFWLFLFYWRLATYWRRKKFYRLLLWIRN